MTSLTAKAREARLARAIKVGTLRPAIVLYDEAHPLGDDMHNFVHSTSPSLTHIHVLLSFIHSQHTC